MKALLNAGREGGWILALGVALIAIALLYLKVPEHVGAPLPTSETNLNLPSSPVDVQLADVACNAEAIEKAPVSAGLPPIYTYTLKHTTKTGSSVFVRWTDAAGMLGQNAVVEINGVTAHPEPDERTKKCLRERATPAPSTGGPR